MFGRELQKKKKNIFLTNLTLFEVSYFYVDIERERERGRERKKKEGSDAQLARYSHLKLSNMNWSDVRCKLM